ncbi:MAG: sulfotransferase family protein [Rubrobacteraceae bacterium]
MDAKRQQRIEERERRREERRRQRQEDRRMQKEASIAHPMPPEEMQVEDVRFFAVGNGRSGTTWLEHTLNTHPEILCKGSGMFFGKDIRNFGGRRLLYEVLAHSEGLKTWHEIDLNEWTDPEEFERDVDQITRAAIDALMRRWLTGSGKRVLGDRTPHHIAHLQEVHTLYPKARIVHAVRDGRDVAISNLHVFWGHSPDRGGPANISPEEIEIRDAYLEDRGVFLRSGRSIFTEERIRQQATGWSRIVRKGRKKGKELFGDNYIELKYEDHLHRPEEALERLFRFLEVDANPEVIQAVVEANRFEKLTGRSRGQESSGEFMRKGISGDWRETFTERDRRIFKEEAGELLVELGYEKDLSW